MSDWAAALPPRCATFSLPFAALHLAPAIAAVLSPPPDTLSGLLLGTGPAAATERLLQLMLDYRIVYDLGRGAACVHSGFASEAPVDTGVPPGFSSPSVARSNQSLCSMLPAAQPALCGLAAIGEGDVVWCDAVHVPHQCAFLCETSTSGTLYLILRLPCQFVA